MTSALPSLVTDVVGDVAASTRARLYQQLADFQAIPSRINRVLAQLAAFQNATAGRSFDDSATLAGLTDATHALQSQWGSANAAVTQAIASLSSSSVSIGLATQVAGAIAGMTVSTQGIAGIEQQTRDLIEHSSVLTDDQKAQLLAVGAPAQLTIGKLALYVVGGYVVAKMLRIL